jgi:hypothetical protein
VIVAVSGLVDPARRVTCGACGAPDALTLGVTFVATLLIGVEQGILIGVGASLAAARVAQRLPARRGHGRLDEQGVWRNVARYPEARLTEGWWCCGPTPALLRQRHLPARRGRARTRGARRRASAWSSTSPPSTTSMPSALDGLEHLIVELDQRGLEVHLAA